MGSRARRVYPSDDLPHSVRNCRLLSGGWPTDLPHPTDLYERNDMWTGEATDNKVDLLRLIWLPFLFRSGDNRADYDIGPYRNFRAVFGWGLWMFPVDTSVRVFYSFISKRNSLLITSIRISSVSRILLAVNRLISWIAKFQVTDACHFAVRWSVVDASETWPWSNKEIYCIGLQHWNKRCFVELYSMFFGVTLETQGTLNPKNLSISSF